MTEAADPLPAESGAPPAVDWESCLVTHRTWLRKVIHARTGEVQAVDEVFQEVALAAVEQRSPLADPAKAAPWLHRLAVVHSARYRRRLGRQRNAVRRAVEQHHLGNGHAGDLLAWLVARERQERTRAALDRLAGRDAEILLLKYGERWTYREIAERLGISEKAVDSRLVRARARLRQELIELGIHEHE
jgi:RNA polymerase sigma factor (sigma-70 family)